MKQIFLLLLMMGSFHTVLGANERSKRINAIKMDVATYLYGETTAVSQEEATSLAYGILQKEVLNWAQRDSIKLSIKSASDINRLADTIMTQRANMIHVFAYVKKSDLMSSAPTDSVQASIPVSESPQLKHHRDSLVTDEVRSTINKRFFGKTQNRMSDALLRLKEAKNFFELKEIMQPLKEKGDIVDYGKYATAEQPELCYLIIYDPAGNIRALLGKGRDKRLNLKTGQEDSVSNYRGCGALWFTMKE